MNDMDKIIEVDTHAANLRSGRFTLVDAKRIATDVLITDRSDPSIYQRTISQLMNNSAQPADFVQHRKRAVEVRKEHALKLVSK